MRMSHFHTAGILLVSVCGAGTARAQVASVSGIVVLKQGDQATPIPNAQIDFYRTDIGGNYVAQTNTRGEYVFAGLPLIGTYTVVVSAPGAQPTVFQGCRFTQNLRLNAALELGDGRRPTYEQARANGAGSCARPPVSTQMTESTGSSTFAEAATPAAVKMDLASLYNSGRVDETITESRAILGVAYDDLEAHLYLGIALATSHNTKNFQEAADHLTWFVTRAPDDDRRKEAAQGQLNFLQLHGIVGRAPASSNGTSRRRR